MQTITIAVVPALNQKEDGTFWCDPVFAPIWTDGKTDYLVASGQLEGEFVTSDPVKAQPNRVNIVADVEGFTALVAMGLSPKPPAGE